MKKNTYNKTDKILTESIDLINRSNRLINDLTELATKLEQLNERMVKQ
jgi:hypothetical protein